MSIVKRIKLKQETNQYINQAEKNALEYLVWLHDELTYQALVDK